MTQYTRILDYLRKHRVATVRDLLRFTNYPSARIHEMEQGEWLWADAGTIKPTYGGGTNSKGYATERITRTWVQRNGKKVRLYCLTKA